MKEIRSTQVGVKMRGASVQYTLEPNTVDHNNSHWIRGKGKIVPMLN
jgi:hypothetical protein